MVMRGRRRWPPSGRSPGVDDRRRHRTGPVTPPEEGMMPISKRDRLAGMLSNGGLLRALELLARRPRLLVLNYHRIGSGAEDRFDDGAYSATAEAFRGQVR